MSDRFVYDSDYRGPRFTYGLVNRPVMYGTVPAGYIIGSDRPDAPDPRVRYGTISYPFRLSARDIYGKELLPIDDNLGRYAEMSLSDIWRELLRQEQP